MRQPLRNYAFLVLACALTACAGFTPQDTPETIGYAQEKLDTALGGLEVAYDTGAITQATKNRLLKRWQELKDISDAALLAYAKGENYSGLDSARRQVRAFVMELIRLGILKDGDEA